MRGEKTRAGDRWTEARYFSFIRSALRGAFSKYPPKFDAKIEARTTVEGQRHRYEYQCASCGNTFRDKEVQVDHIKPAGSLKTFDDLPSFVENLFCEVENLQVLCKDCHKAKTKEEREAKKYEE